MTSNTLAEIAAALKSARRIIVLSHYNPDPDAYGSSCGLTLGLQALGKNVVCVNESGVLPRLNWIPGVARIASQLPEGDWDAVVACDCGDKGRVGDVLKTKLASYPLVINIDHHASNDFFGNLNYVIPEACSTSEMIADLLDELSVPWSADMATCLYSGLSSDTGSFKYSSTTKKTFAVASKLVDHGAEPFEIAQHLYASNSAQSVTLQAEALSGLKLCNDGKTAFVAVTADMLAKTGAAREDADPLVDIARDIEGVLVAVLFKEDEGLWRVSLRAKGSKVDVSKIAAMFGGGGHKAAAGFRWRRERAELESKLFAEITEALQ